MCFGFLLKGLIFASLDSPENGIQSLRKWDYEGRIHSSQKLKAKNSRNYVYPIEAIRPFPLFSHAATPPRFTVFS